MAAGKHSFLLSLCVPLPQGDEATQPHVEHRVNAGMY